MRFLPHNFRFTGWLFLLIGLDLLVVLLLNNFNYPNWEATFLPIVTEDGLFSSEAPLVWSKTNISDEIATLFILLGVFFISLSKGKVAERYAYS